MAIGLLPPIPIERVHRAGNAAIHGAALLLLSRRLRSELERQCRRIEHVELEQDPDFFDAFVDGCRYEPFEPLRPLDPGAPVGPAKLPDGTLAGASRTAGALGSPT